MGRVGRPGAGRDEEPALAAVDACGNATAAGLGCRRFCAAGAASVAGDLTTAGVVSMAFGL
ncbi:hypothetical protein [Sodalis glossinidius]|uniref:hypothetical protein n=1 Tax=Sodalis glossinidius TaxID=63612 RepID=UPI0014134060|nr:hypothetical protein [Sodalis glossinidius]